MKNNIVCLHLRINKETPATPIYTGLATRTDNCSGAIPIGLPANLIVGWTLAGLYLTSYLLPVWLPINSKFEQYPHYSIVYLVFESMGHAVGISLLSCTLQARISLSHITMHPVADHHLWFITHPLWYSVHISFFCPCTQTKGTFLTIEKSCHPAPKTLFQLLAFRPYYAYASCNIRYRSHAVAIV